VRETSPVKLRMSYLGDVTKVDAHVLLNFLNRALRVLGCKFFSPFGRREKREVR